MVWLIFSSLFFYAWWKPVYLILLLGSIAFNFLLGSLLSGKQTPRAPQSVFWLTIGIAVNLVVLGYFKYSSFFVTNFNHLTNSNFHFNKIILPLAISFFTFQQIAYLVDAYRGRTKTYSLLQYCLFVTFFPQLIAGPIVHHSEMFPQFNKPGLLSINWSNTSIGVTIFAIGLFKKVVMADGLSTYATPVFSAAEQGVVIHFFEGWTSALSYTFQLYFDFSGYSDMAIGIAKMFNIELPQNFKSPYKSKNIIEFWRRWHITLSRFLKHYLYIPLGGNRKGNRRRYTSLMVTMLLGGLWHGASWTFVIWGGLHGLYLTLNHGWQQFCKSFGFNLKKSSFTGRCVGRLITFLSVVVAWVIFRAESFSGAINVLSGMLGLQGFVLPAQVAGIIPVLSAYVETVGTMPLLGGGTIMGVFEMIGMFGLSFILLLFRPIHEMSNTSKFLALVASLYFTVQAVFFSRAPSEFLYFQF